MILKTSTGITETNDSNQNAKAIFSPEQESLTITEKSQELITVPTETTGMSISFGTGIASPKLIMLKASGELLITIGDGTDTIELTMNADESYRLPTGISTITVTNESTTDDVTLEKIIAE